MEAQGVLGESKAAWSAHVSLRGGVCGVWGWGSGEVERGQRVGGPQGQRLGGGARGERGGGDRCGARKAVDSGYTYGAYECLPFVACRFPCLCACRWGCCEAGVLVWEAWEWSKAKYQHPSAC